MRIEFTNSLFMNWKLIIDRVKLFGRYDGSIFGNKRMKFGKRNIILNSRSVAMYACFISDLRIGM